MSRIRVAFAALFSSWLKLPAIVRAAAPVAAMIVLWFASSVTPPARKPSLLQPLIHNSAHIVAYFGLCGAWVLTLLGRSLPRASGVPRPVAIASPALAVAYGVVDEIHQSFVPGRCCSMWDVFSDASGSVLAVCFVAWALSGERRFARGIGWSALVACVCVVLATWPPF